MMKLITEDRTIAACRAVIRLLEFSSGEVYIHSMPAIANGNPKYLPKRPEVHVTTEHITMAEFSPSGANSPYSKNHSHRTSSIDLQSARDTEVHSVEKNAKESFEFPGTPV